MYLSLYSKNKFSTIASGATPIGSAGHAPDDVYLSIILLKQQTTNGGD
jgi:hypothetical protein